MTDGEFLERFQLMEAEVGRLREQANLAGKMFDCMTAQARMNSRESAQAEADSAVLLALVSVLRHQPHMQLAIQHALEKVYSTLLQQMVDDDLLDYFRARADEFEAAIGVGPEQPTGG